MIKPAFLEREDQPEEIGRVFGVPLVVKGISGLPALELVAAAILTLVARRKRPDWPAGKQVGAGVINASILFGSEWGHNLAHTLVASLIGKPVDAIRIFWGTPLLIYYDITDQQVEPHQHILRASGGPLFNGVLVLMTWVIRHMSPAGSLARYVADFAFQTNTFILMGSLLPIPGIDGGPLLKWSLVEAGRSLDEADEVVKSVNRYLGAGLLVASGLAAKKRKKWLAGGALAFAATALAIGFGLLKEQK